MKTTTPLSSRKAIVIAVAVLGIGAAGTFTLTSRAAKPAAAAPVSKRD